MVTLWRKIASFSKCKIVRNNPFLIHQDGTRGLYWTLLAPGISVDNTTGIVPHENPFFPNSWINFHHLG
jgi:hypothetical protein